MLAFRKVYKVSENIKTSQCNIHFCKTVFDEIHERKTCIVLCFDIKKFFDNLNHEILKENWCELLEVQRLPLDHFKVYKSLTQYASVDKIFLYKVTSAVNNGEKHLVDFIRQPDGKSLGILE